MKNFLATVGIVSTLVPSLGFAFDLNSYEAETQVVARYTTGKLDDRLIELGSNKQTGEFVPVTAKTHKDGVIRYCSFYLKALGQNSDLCARTIKVHAPNGDFTF